MSTPTLKKAENGVFYARWSKNGRSLRKSMATKDQAEAQTRFGRWLLTDAVVDATPTATIGQLWSVYREKHVERTAAPESVDYCWRNLEPVFGNIFPSEVTQNGVDAYVAARIDGDIGRPSKSSTVRKELATLRAGLNWCASAARRPILLAQSDVPVFELPEDAEPRSRWLTMAEMQKLLKAAVDLRKEDRLSRGERFLWIALETGARKQAILELTWDRVDFHTGTIHFAVPGVRPTSKRRAAVAISTALRPILMRAFAERNSDFVLDTTHEVWAAVQKIARKAGFGKRRGLAATGISPHVLRHTAATHMARAGVPLFAIAKTLGNSVATVEKHYAKWCPGDPASTVDRISGGALTSAE